jgi:hypothetical protein
MKDERLHTRELELLSTYLDGELRPADRQALEARLMAEPELCERLENFRKAKIIVGHLPRLRAPHNFTLTPEMVTVRQKKAQPFAATMQLATALAAVLLVVSFGAEFLITNRPLATRQMADEPMMEAAMAKAEPVPLIFWGVPGAGGYGGAGAEGLGGDGMMMDVPVMMEALPVEVEVAVEEALIPEEEPGLMLVAPEVEVESLVVASGMDGDLPILGLNLEQGGEIISRSMDAIVDDFSPLVWRIALRWLQVGLGVILVGGGLIWWFLRRRG